MKLIKKGIGILGLVFIMMLPSISAFAATKDFTFDMTHQLTIGTYKMTKSTATATIYMKSWGGDTFFTIHVYDEDDFWASYVGRMEFEKSSAGSPYTDSISLTKGRHYDFEIWKNMNGKRIQGSGSLSY